jgi:hypothetical protein
LSRFEIVPRRVVPDLRDAISCHFDQRDILHRVLRGSRSYNSRILDHHIIRVAVAAVESMPECGVTPAGCMVTLAAVSEECPGEIPDIIKSVRLNCLEMLRARLNDALVAGELPSTTDVDRLSRFYLGVYQGIAIQARDGATSAELKGVAETAMAAWPGMKANRKRRA